MRLNDIFRKIPTTSRLGRAWPAVLAVSLSIGGIVLLIVAAVAPAALAAAWFLEAAVL